MATSRTNRTIAPAATTREDRAIGRAGERGTFRAHADGYRTNALRGEDRREANRRSRHTAREAIRAFQLDALPLDENTPEEDRRELDALIMADEEQAIREDWCPNPRCELVGDHDVCMDDGEPLWGPTVVAAEITPGGARFNARDVHLAHRVADGWY